MRKLVVLAALLSLLSDGAAQAEAVSPSDIAGIWALSLDKGALSCRITLQPQKSDKGDFFLGLPPACRHTMPALAKVGRWSMPDAAHVALGDASGTTLLVLAKEAPGFALDTAAGRYTMTLLAASGRSAAGFTTLDAPDVAQAIAPVERIASRRRKADAEEAAPQSASDTAGRYAVMRGTRDTGCMLTLDTAGVAGGRRAQLAPGCRDQGIVVFDPAAWSLVKGDLVLTARAGHKAVLAKEGEGAWAKDAKGGGKPLGLKRL